ncbi:MAG: hypothetical protein OEY89_07755 [Gammaproteobacteria bacterium]|nr:hypothetical protein [Gammaproteobacteria bacterium]
MSENNNKPLWVTISWILLGLTNIETRKGAMNLFWAFVVSSFLCIPVSYYLNDWLWAGMMFPLSLWLWICIKWGDKNAAWKTAD